MSTRRTIAWAIIVALLALGIGQLWRARSRSERVEKEIAEVQTRNRVIEAELRRLEQRKSAPAPAAPLQATAAVMNSPAQPPSAVMTPDASQLVATHPELVAKFDQAFRAQYAQEYGALYRQLGLPAAQIEQFERRLFQDQLDKLDLSWTARAQGLKRDDPALQVVRRQQDAALETDLRSILGIEGYDALEQSRRANGVRPFINEVATAMTLAECAMTRAQQDSLLRLVADHSQRYRQGGAAQRWDVDWETVMTQAPGFLNPAQVASLRTHGDRSTRFVWLLPQFYSQRGGAK